MQNYPQRYLQSLQSMKQLQDIVNQLRKTKQKQQEDIQLFNQALSNDGELIGERLATLSRILKEMGY